MNDNLVQYEKYPSIAYCPREGYICRITKDGGYLRHLVPNESNMVNIFVLDKGSFTNRKAINLAYEIFNTTEVPKGYLVYPKDADDTNIKANNLGLMSKEDHVKYKDAIDNILKETLRITFGSGKYKVRYKHLGRTTTKKFDDLIIATAFKKQVYLESIRLISKFFVNK